MSRRTCRAALLSRRTLLRVVAGLLVVLVAAAGLGGATATPRPNPSSPSAAGPGRTGPATPPLRAVAAGINFGSGYEQAFEAMTGAEQSTVMGAVAATGASWLRMDIPFSGEEGPPGHFTWYVQPEVSEAVAHGLSVDGLIAYSPSWATNTDGTPNIPDYTAFVAAAVSHYAPLGVHTWEIWNEPNLAANWGSRSVNPSEYTAMLESVYPVIKHIDPSATVLTAGLSPASDSPNGSSMEPITFLGDMYADGAHGYFDAVADHPYSFPTLPDTSQSGNPFQYLPRLHALMAQNGDGSRKIWLTEFGSPTGGSGVTPAVQADMISEAFDAADHWSWSGPVMIFDWQDTKVDGAFGLHTATGEPKPALAAFDAVADRRLKLG